MDPALPEFLRQSQIFASADGKVLTVYADGFAHLMLSTPDAMKHIAEAFALARITAGRAEVRIVKRAQNKKSDSPADELGRLL